MQVDMKSTDTQAWEAKVSHWMDGDDEIRVDDLDSPYGRQVWDTYHLIGDVLRSDDLAFRPSDLFYARLSHAIDAEPQPQAAEKRGLAGVRWGWSGVAVAAAVATVAWVALPYLTADPTPGVAAPMMATADEPVIHNYVDAHRQFAGASPIRQVSLDVGIRD